MKSENEIIDSLIETLKDGQEGFKQAAEGVKDPRLKSLFEEYSRQRGRFAMELRSHAQRPDERQSEMSGSAAGALHRGWINLKSALTRGDDHAILAECERGEDSAVEEFRKALDSGLSAPVRDIVSRQYAEIKAAHDRINICATLPNRADSTTSVGSKSRIGMGRCVPSATKSARSKG